MAYQVQIKRSAENEMDDIPSGQRSRIIKRLLSLSENPRPSGIKKLQVVRLKTAPDIKRFLART